MELKSSALRRSTKKHARCPSPSTSRAYWGSNCPCSGCHSRNGLGELKRAALFASSFRSGFSLVATSNRAACSGFFVEGVLTLHLQPELAALLKDHLGRHPSSPPSTVGFPDKLLALRHLS